MKDFTVTLISNGSEQYLSDNTLTNFTNQLPNDIYLSKHKNGMSHFKIISRIIASKS